MKTKHLKPGRALDKIQWNREMTTLKILLVLIPLLVVLVGIAVGAIVAYTPVNEMPLTLPLLYVAALLIAGLALACGYPVVKLNQLLRQQPV
ncbi:hypothetical protein [Rheinheimera sp.]|uniref:hypothetical protein n=1 Tax=Rheinheimera sp. TaxID=1869214 RepID=UPI00307E7F6D